MRLDKIHISDFKFFDRNRSIDVGSKNLLIYGENGSGKSSIYWALYTLFDSALKNDRGEIEKYFNLRHNDVLVNIYAKNNRYSFVKIELSNGDVFEISPTNYNIIEDTTTNTRAQAIDLASDFINYRMLYRFHDFKHSKDFEVFDFFLKEILTYLTIPVLTNRRADKIWKELINGPEKGYDLNRDLVYPVASDLSISDPQMQDLQKKYKTYRNKINKFNSWLKGLLTSIEAEANNILQNDLKQTFTIRIKFSKSIPQITRSEPNISIPKIQITIPEWNGIKKRVKKGHTFLNEARLTALATSIRFGILRNRLHTADLRLLTLDDLLISLDMGYRDLILDVILKKMTSDYQIILMTHDYNFFQFINDKIDKHNRYLTNLSLPQIEWKVLEMYEYKDGRKSIPYLTQSITNLEKAKKYFYQREKDIPASANYMRKATEKFCDEFLPLTQKYGSTFQKFNLSTLINRTINEANLQGLPLGLFNQLDSYRMTIFNPGSHYNLNNPPLFTPELERAIITLEQLSMLTGIKI